MQDLIAPDWAKCLADSIFTGAGEAFAMTWPIRLLEAVPVGMTESQWESVRHGIAIKRLLKLADVQERAIGDRWGVVKAIRHTIAYHKNPRSAARSAAAWSARSAAAWSARSAESAARSAWLARSAESAARSAAAWSAASAAAASAAVGWSTLSAAGWSTLSASAAGWSTLSASAAGWSTLSAAWEEEGETLLQTIAEVTS